MDLLIILIVTPLTAVFCGFYVGGIQTLIDWLDDRQERRKRCKTLDEQIKLYTVVRDGETDDFQKGYWEARILNLQYERQCL